jgi:hypothetical protein
MNTNAVVSANRVKLLRSPYFASFNGRIDDAYRAKYDSNPYLDPMISARARSATVKIAPKNLWHLYAGWNVNRTTAYRQRSV